MSEQVCRSCVAEVHNLPEGKSNELVKRQGHWIAWKSHPHRWVPSYVEKEKQNNKREDEGTTKAASSSDIAFGMRETLRYEYYHSQRHHLRLLVIRLLSVYGTACMRETRTDLFDSLSCRLSITISKNVHNSCSLYVKKAKDMKLTTGLSNCCGQMLSARRSHAHNGMTLPISNPAFLYEISTTNLTKER